MLDHNAYSRRTGQVVSLYAADEFRASDREAVIMGLYLGVSETRVFRLIATSRRIARAYHRCVVRGAIH